MKVFLDDVRIPNECVTYMYKRIGALNPIYLEQWEIVRNYSEFVDCIEQNIGKITHVSFDHDLGEDLAIQNREKGLSKRAARKIKKLSKSGYDCAVWMKDFYAEKNVKLPIMFVHSQNEKGASNIISVFT